MSERRILGADHPGVFVGDLMDNRFNVAGSEDRCIFCGRKVEENAASIHLNTENKIDSKAPEYAVGSECERKLRRHLKRAHDGS